MLNPCVIVKMITDCNYIYNVIAYDYDYIEFGITPVRKQTL